MTSAAGAAAPDPSVETGPPQTDEELAVQAAKHYDWAQGHHGALLAHVEFTKRHVASMVQAEQDAADAFEANDLAAAQAAHEAAQARIGGAA